MTRYKVRCAAIGQRCLLNGSRTASGNPFTVYATRPTYMAGLGGNLSTYLVNVVISWSQPCFILLRQVLYPFSYPGGMEDLVSLASTR